MSPGALLLRFKTTTKHGLRVAYFRDIVRPRILNSAPIQNLGGNRCEIHVLTSKDDWINLLWALKSFYLQSGRRYGLCIHDDGTLTDEIRTQLRAHFPDARLIERAKANEVARERLAGFPRALDFRLTNHLAPKLFDFPAELRAPRMFLLDSDVLFFEAPTELLRRIEAPDYRLNSVNRDVNDASTVDFAVVKAQTGVDLEPRFNSGLGVIHGDSLRLDWIEEFLALPNILSHFWRIEQTLYALCSSRYGCELLPTEYDVYLGTKPGFPKQSRHYVGAVRHLMYGEGIARLMKTDFFGKLEKFGAQKGELSGT